MTSTNNSHPDWDVSFAGLDTPFGAPQLPLTDVSFYVYTSPALGRLLLASNPERVLVACTYVGNASDEDRILAKLVTRMSPRILRHRDIFDQHIAELEEYLRGDRQNFDINVDLRLATPFQKEVLEDVRQSLPYGRVATYSDVAQHIDRPKARRAVGSALGANPVCIFVPCHRVLGAGGSLSGYAGGLEAKQLLLELEGIAPK